MGKIGVSWKTLLATSVLFVGGCFDEPVPASKTVPKESRVYLNDKGLADLSRQGEVLAKVGDYLNLDRNALTNVAPVANIAGLKWLRLNDNRLAALPDLGKLVNLRRIYLKNNRFTEIPAALKDLSALTDVDISGNPIKEVPEWFVQKKGLKNVSLSRTLVTALPADLTAWKDLSSLQLGELRIPAAEIARIRKELPEVAIVF